MSRSAKRWIKEHDGKNIKRVLDLSEETVHLVIDPRKSNLTGEHLDINQMVVSIELFYNHHPTGEDWYEQCIDILKSFPHVLEVDFGVDEECMELIYENYPEIERLEIVHGLPCSVWNKLPNLHTFYLLFTSRTYDMDDYEMVPKVTTLHLYGTTLYEEIKFFYLRGVKVLYVEELEEVEFEEFQDLIIYENGNIVAGKKYLELKQIM